MKSRKEFDRAGVYILVGYGEDDDELPRIYVGEGDGIRARIEQHDQKKEFWTWAISFTSNAGALNKAHVQWLEYALIRRAKEADQCVLDNGNEPQAPALSEHEEADVGGFLDHMLRILPLVNLRAFEPFGDSGKYRLVFAEPATKLGPIPFGDATTGSMQSARYTTYARLKAAKKVTDFGGCNGGFEMPPLNVFGIP